MFIEGFVNGCNDIRELGYDAPSAGTINSALTNYNAGFQIEKGVLVAKRWVPLEDPDASVLAELVSQGYPPDPQLATFIESENLIVTDTPKPTTPSKPVVKAFLCHSSGDKPEVKRLYKSLKDVGHDPWLDVVSLLPGQDWDAEIKKAVKNAHVVIVCLSHSSVSKTGYVQKEIKFALDVADEQPEGTIYIIPARLDDCPVPDRLAKWYWVDLFDQDGYEKLLASLKKRAEDLK
jgi:hypothetical protein